MAKAIHSKSSATKALEKATKDWRSAKKRERAARNALAAIVNEAVSSGVMSENKVASVTAIPRMTIRKMLGKDDTVAESADESIVAAVVDLPVVTEDAVEEDVVDSDATEPDATSADEATEPVASGEDAAPSDADTDEAAETSPSSDLESPASAVTTSDTPEWGGIARPSLLA
jgi:hypothetical protein